MDALAGKWARTNRKTKMSTDNAAILLAVPDSYRFLVSCRVEESDIFKILLKLGADCDPVNHGCNTLLFPNTTLLPQPTLLESTEVVQDISKPLATVK